MNLNSIIFGTNVKSLINLSPPLFSNTEKCNGSPKCMIVNSDKESAKASSIATDIINCEATVTPNNGVANKVSTEKQIN